ncbi:NAD(P)-binding protein [Polyplosphaeria fusca]|uniref:NAD(P)-binding protein n=1 Tax=Polyplosphaeria fusca TaxID=682080 RepID=A0A9P4R466_9PLEO|nr:NAD(P)-binding protein [Polyplosphaeria fusca]
MVALDVIRAHNATLRSLPPGLVAVFVGGTSGIGYSTARELVRHTTDPHVYLVGRSQEEASRIIAELKEINATSRTSFIKSDVSLLKSVDEVCKEIKEKEKKVNLLFMTAGYTTMAGRQETIEGLDKKFALHYYARMRFVQNLSPLLATAGNDSDQSARLSRVVSVLDSRVSSAPDFSDLSLKRTFSLKNCAKHATAMNNFALEHFARQQPSTAFVHAFPFMVSTGTGRELKGIAGGIFKVMSPLMKPFAVDLKESGERHLYASTVPHFASKDGAADVATLAMGMDGVKGSGAYALNWDGEIVDNAKLGPVRAQGAERKIWDHTEEVFKTICQEDKKY